MQSLPPKSAESRLRRIGESCRFGFKSRAIERIAEERMANMGEMDADLMGSPRLERAGYEARLVSIALDEPVVGARMPSAAGRDNSDFLTVGGVPGERGINRARGPLRSPPHEGEVLALEQERLAVVSKKRREALMRGIRFRNHEEARRILIESVHNAGPPHAPDARKARPAMGNQRIYERALLMASTRMNHEPGGLIDDEKMLILIDDIERDIFPARDGPGGLGNRQTHALSGAQDGARIPHLSIFDRNMTRLDEMLYSGARKTRPRC